MVEDPSLSSPGLAFLLVTIERFGESGWQDYWIELRDNGVLVAPGWTEAYYGEFSGGAGEGTRPLVVSYASSPPVEVLFSDPPVTEAPTGVITDGCYRQTEFAGILAGTEHAKQAGALIDFMLSPEFQATIPLTWFVYPANSTVALARGFRRALHCPRARNHAGPGDHRTESRAMADRVGRPLRLRSWWVWVLPVAFLGYFFLFPVTRVLIHALEENAFAELTRPRFLASAWFTVWQAVLSTLLTLVAALPLTWALARFNFPGKPLVRALVTIPFVLPTVVVGAAFSGTYAAGGRSDPRRPCLLQHCCGRANRGRSLEPDRSANGRSRPGARSFAMASCLGDFLSLAAAGAGVSRSRRLSLLLCVVWSRADSRRWTFTHDRGRDLSAGSQLRQPPGRRGVGSLATPLCDHLALAVVALAAADDG